MQRHVNAVHENIRKYACLECDRKFTFKYGVAEHMKRVHKKIKRETSTEDSDTQRSRERDVEAEKRWIMGKERKMTS